MTKKIAVVSEKLGNEEDFMIVGDAHIDDFGNIYPRSTSNVESEDDTLTIEPVHKAKLNVGDIVVGIVSDIKKNHAGITIQKNLTNNKNIDLPAQLPVGEMSFAFIKEIRDALRIGDVIKAKIVKMGSDIELSIKDRDLGVEIAYCINCRHKLGNKPIFRNKDIVTVSCGNCYMKQTRKSVGM